MQEKVNHPGENTSSCSRLLDVSQTRIPSPLSRPGLKWMFLSVPCAGKCLQLRNPLLSRHSSSAVGQRVENHPRNGSAPPALLEENLVQDTRMSHSKHSPRLGAGTHFITFNFFCQAVPAPSFKCRNCGQLQRVCLLPIKEALERSRAHSFFM